MQNHETLGAVHTHTHTHTIYIRITVGDRACQYWCVKFYTFFVESDMAIKKSCHFFWCNHIIQQQFKGEFLV